MPPFPLDLIALLTKPGAYIVYGLIGFAFGYVLEISGFAISNKLAAQFYFKEMTVLKVMFTAIVVAMVLIFGATALGLLDYNLIWVNPTYLWPGIVGGLIMGVGFIVGGFCPGTSLVAVSTFKVDGLFFALGGLFGIFLFGETVQYFEDFWYSSYLGRFTLPELFKTSYGVVIVGVILMALFMFWGGEQLEHIFGKKDLKKEPRVRYAGAAALLAGAMIVAFIGQPTTAARWAKIAPAKEAVLNERTVQIQPAELLSLIHDHHLNIIMLDLRNEADYNLFHINGARRVMSDQITDLVPELRLEPANTVVVAMSNDEAAATNAWKALTADSVPNVYILEGGINNWLDTYAKETTDLASNPTAGNDQLKYIFPAALGARYPFADPDPEEFKIEFTPKVQLQNKRGATSGGCG
jgi:rhodanese-related sulfurtransferase